jgi:CRP-like cAMP-binding protein
VEADPERIGNRFLDALPRAVARRCAEAGTVRSFAPGEIVAHRDDRIVAVHFPLSGAISEVEEGLDGGTVEVTVIGFEGVSAVEALLDDDAEPFLRKSQVATRAIAIPVAEARALRDAEPALHLLVHRYAGARLRAAGITIGCNARHAAHARLARWLLRMNDRVGHGDFELTHETISMMLGVRRATVTRAIASLAERGAIAVARNSVRIASRTVLESLACSCYPESRALYDALYGGAGGVRLTDI